MKIGDQVRKIFLLIGASFLLSGCGEQSVNNTFSAVSEPEADDTEVSGTGSSHYAVHGTDTGNWK